MGILTVQSELKNAYDDYKLKAFKALASYISIAMENGRLYEKVHLMAIKDPLTGILNRTHFFTLVESEFEKYKRYGNPFSFIMFDLNHFKKINDRYGHSAGDIVLKKVSYFCNQEIRDVDFICRYGGEEFLILLPNTKLDKALILAEALRRELEELKLDIGNEK